MKLKIIYFIASLLGVQLYKPRKGDFPELVKDRDQSVPSMLLTQSTFISKSMEILQTEEFFKYMNENLFPLINGASTLYMGHTYKVVVDFLTLKGLFPQNDADLVEFGRLIMRQQEIFVTYIVKVRDKSKMQDLAGLLDKDGDEFFEGLAKILNITRKKDV